MLYPADVPLYHVNFHTLHSVPVFEHPEYDMFMRSCLRELVRRHRIPCLVWEIMPTHVHLIVEDFRDFPCSQIVGRLKGGASYTGCGIPPADLPRIWERFYRVERGRDRRQAGGLGLGLAICRGSIALLGGSIQVESTLNQGTTFTIQLPLTH
jgi:signal transduction histidine kinase